MGGKPCLATAYWSSGWWWVARIVVVMSDTEDSRSAADQQFVQTMKRMRQERGWSQTDLAKALKERGWGVARQAIVSRIEQGEREVRLGEAYLVAQVLGMSVESMAAPDEVHLLLRSLDSDADQVRHEAEAVARGQDALRRRVDHLRSDVARAEAYLADQEGSPHRGAIQRALDTAKEVLHDASQVGA